jgi:hypothetical protein
MLSLSRRRAPLNKTPEGDGLLGLPDDILILISEQCRIDELLALRLTSSRTRNLIDEYQSTITPSVARSTFRHSKLLLRPLDDGSDRNLRWLLALIPRQLAAILVDRHRTVSDHSQYSHHGIPAEAECGDALRARVANGWHVLRQISNIAREVHSAFTRPSPTSAADVIHKLVHPSRFKLSTLKQVDDAIRQQRLEYIRALPDQLAQDYRLMMILLSSVFSTHRENQGDEHSPWIFDWGGGIDGPRFIRQGKSWLTWFIMNEGPDLFWNQWCSLPHEAAQNYIRDRATGVFKALPPGLADYQRSLAETLRDAVYAKTPDFNTSNPHRYFGRWWRIQNEQIIEPVKETMAHVPFLVKFRCPEDVVTRGRYVQTEPYGV